MRRLGKIICVVFCLFGIIGCSDDQSPETPKISIIEDSSVGNMSITSLPSGYEYSFSKSDVNPIIEYLKNLNLTSDFEENPDTYAGMTYVISIEYDNGNSTTIYHFGNKFIRVDDGPWYLMSYDEASALERILSEYDKTAGTIETTELSETTNETDSGKNDDEVNKETTSAQHPLYEKFPEYFNLSEFKGLEVYVWEVAKGVYKCGVLEGTNRNKTEEEILKLSFTSATIEEMKEILSVYDIEKDGVIIIPVRQPISSYFYEIDEEYIAKIEELFWGE